MKGVCSKTIHELHQKYGLWVRIAPNEISTCDPEAIVPIYGVNSAFVKTEFYTWQFRGVPELFTMSDRKQHARRRRELAHLFSMSAITEYEPVIAKHVRTCIGPQVRVHTHRRRRLSPVIRVSVHNRRI